MSREFTKVSPDTIRELAFGSIGASYAAVGTALSSIFGIIGLFNNTNQTVYFSWDGTNNHHKISAGGFRVFDLSACSNGDGDVYGQQGITFYVKHAGVAPTTNEVTVEVLKQS